MTSVLPEITIIGVTMFTPGAATKLQDRTGWEVPSSADATDAEAIIEFAGRGCYESWDKPNPETSTNAGYLDHILEVGHFSVIEHGTLVYYIRGVSRSLTHELVRHRHFSYSQLSQRYVDPGENATDTGYIIPPAFSDNEKLLTFFSTAAEIANAQYENLIGFLKEEKPGLTNKEYRQAARAVLPNMTETRLVLSGNFRALRHFFGMRCTSAADVEIRAVAIEMLRQAKRIQPNVFYDFKISKLSDGTEVASTLNSEV